MHHRCVLALTAFLLCGAAAAQPAHASDDAFILAPGYGWGTHHYKLSQATTIQPGSTKQGFHDYGLDFTPSMTTYFLIEPGVILGGLNEATRKETARMGAERQLAEERGRGGTATSKQYAWEKGNAPPMARKVRWHYSTGTARGVTYSITDHSIGGKRTSFFDPNATAEMGSFGLDVMNPENYGTLGISGFYANFSMAFWYQWFKTSTMNKQSVLTTLPAMKTESNDAMFLIGGITGYRPPFFRFLHVQAYARYDIIGGALGWLVSPGPRSLSADWGAVADATLFYTTLEYRLGGYITPHYFGTKQPWQVASGTSSMLSLRFDIAGLIFGLMK